MRVAFFFLRGASSCEELFAQAAVSGLEALAITDRNSLAGIVRAHEAAKVTGVRLIVGCPPRACRRINRPCLPDRPTGLRATLPPPISGQGPGWQGQVHSRLGGRRAVRRGHDRRTGTRPAECRLARRNSVGWPRSSATVPIWP